jgi:glucosyl-dolichyl phosphate glucuronosyltransferase
MFLSIIICTRNRAESLRETVNSLFSAQNLEVPGWEVLVIESSADHTDEVCQEFQKKFPQHFRFLNEKKLGKSQALNTGIAAAKGEILAFIDDDVICTSNYVGAIQAAFSTYSTDAVAGRVFLDCEGGYPEWLGTGDLAQMADLQDFGDEAKEWKGTLCGTNMVVRADVFRRSGGFALELGPGPNTVGMWEDTEVSIRMRREGCQMMYVPDQVFYP